MAILHVHDFVCVDVSRACVCSHQPQRESGREGKRLRELMEKEEFDFHAGRRTERERDWIEEPDLCLS